MRLPVAVSFFSHFHCGKKTTSTLSGAQVRHANNRSGKVNIKKAQKEVHYVCDGCAVDGQFN